MVSSQRSYGLDPPGNACLELTLVRLELSLVRLCRWIVFVFESMIWKHAFRYIRNSVKAFVVKQLLIFRQSSIAFEKPGILSYKLKFLTSSNYHRVQYFFLKLRTCFLLTNVCKRMFGRFFILFRSWVI